MLGFAEIIEKYKEVDDPRQEWKVKHKMIDIIMIVLLGMLGNANEWVEIECFAQENEDILKKYLELANGIPSHDTIQRVMSLVNPKMLQDMQLEWMEMLNSGEGETLKKIINIDGKTMRGNGNKNQKAQHVVSAWSKADGVCFGQEVVKAKTNEITAIPELLEKLNIKGQVITIDAMGTQRKIAEQIKKQRGDYVLAVKGNQGILHEEIKTYFSDVDFCNELELTGNYRVKKEKARNQIETRAYYQTNDIDWMTTKKDWKGLTTIGMVQTTIEKDGKISVDRRYYISSLKLDIDLFEKAARGHWAIESMHWHLDVTFREDSNATLERTASLNLNILRKFALSILKLLDVGKKVSLKKKRFIVCCGGRKLIDKLMSL